MEMLDGRGAVITGGASGIGLATSRELGARGVRVVLADIEAPALETAVAALRSEGIDAHSVQCDVTQLDEVVRLADEAFALLGGVHIVFNNAGVALSGPVAALTHDDWRWVIDVDLWGPIHGVEVFLPRMLEHGEGGHLLFTSSFAGLVPNVGLGAYCVAKYGVVALAEVLARELRGQGIGVSVLCPMVVGTNIGSSARNRGAHYGSVPAPGTGTELAIDEVMAVEDVARLTVDAIVAERLYVLPHAASRESIRRRFERIARTFDDQEAAGWTY